MSSELAIATAGFKASKTLLGIETQFYDREINELKQRFKASKTLLGIETLVSTGQLSEISGFKASKTLLGIETAPFPFHASAFTTIQSL